MNKQSINDIKQSKHRYHLRWLRLLDDAISQGPWDKSVFLQAVCDRLRLLRARFSESLTMTERNERVHSATDTLDKDQQQRLYVALYNSQGGDLKQWQQVVKGLTMQTLARPVYRHEADVQAMIASKDTIENEGYIAVNVANNMILHHNEVYQDKMGHALMQLKDKALQRQHVISFHHVSGQYLCQEDEWTPVVD